MVLLTVGVGEGTIACMAVGTTVGTEVGDECVASGVAMGVTTDAFIGGFGRIRTKGACVGAGVAKMTAGSGVAKVIWDLASEGVSTGIGAFWTATIMSDTFTESDGTLATSIIQVPSFCFLAAKSYG